MPDLEPVEQIRMTTSVAKWLVETCVALVRHYLGREFDPTLGTFTERNPELTCLEDRIPVEDFELRHWSAGVINLVTTIAGILHHALTASRLLQLGQILPVDDDSDLTDPNLGREI
jgi:hypothetical protein